MLLSVPFLFLTCGGDKNVSQRYELEKAFDLGEQFRGNLYINLQAATPDDYQKAIAYYQAVKEKSPFPREKSDKDSLDQDSKEMLRLTQQSFIRISELLMTQKKFEEALKEANGYLTDFQKNDFNHQMMAIRKGQIFEMMQKPDSALVQYEQVLQSYLQVHDPQNPNADIIGLPFYVLGLRSSLGQFTPEHVNQTAEFFRKLIASPPTDPLSQVATQNLADLYLKSNDFDKAVSTLETLEDSTGKIYQQPLMAIADLYLVVKKDFVKSRATFNRFVQLYPQDDLTPFAKFGVGRTYYEEGQYQKALDVFAEVKQKYALNPRAVPATQFQIGLTYWKMGNWDRAKTELDWLIINYPDSPEGMKAVGFIADFYRQNNNKELANSYFEKAIKQYQKIISKDPKSSQAYAANQMLTEVYLTQERWKDAASQLESFLKDNPTSPSQPEVLLLLGQLYEEKIKDKQKANQSYAQFLMKFPDDPRAKDAMEKAKKLSLEMQGESGTKVPK